MIDPVPISIRLAMTKINKKAPLQNRNWAYEVKIESNVEFQPFQVDGRKE